MAESTLKTWFITGASSGFGEALGALALEKGDSVAATFRQQEQADAFTAHASGRALGLVCEITDEGQVQQAVAAALAKFQRLDVVVNNAGYGSLGPIEEIPAEEVRRQFDVNVFGPLHVVRAVLPALRAQKSGHILNITSIGGLRAFPGTGIYNGSKFALEGIGESLALQLKPLGIFVTNIEPSGFRTKWAGESATYTKPKIADYEATAGQNVNAISGYSGRQPGDPVRAAQAMYDVVRLENPPVHLPLGKAAVKGAREKFTELLQELEAHAATGDAADFPAGE
jgi:NAD(P)-dependent dehydrogenase (short-subunit alcohol dehydrogenase family)